MYELATPKQVEYLEALERRIGSVTAILIQRDLGRLLDKEYDKLSRANASLLIDEFLAHLGEKPKYGPQITARPEDLAEDSREMYNELEDALERLKQKIRRKG